MIKKIVSLLFIAGLATGLFAAEETDENALATHIELGYTNTGGNTESQDFAGVLEMKYAFGKNDFRLDAAALYSNNEDFDVNETVVTKNRWNAELNFDHYFNDTWAFNYLLGGKGDKFSTFTYQAYTGPGAIWSTVKSKRNDLKFQANLLWSWDEYQEPIEAGSDNRTRDYAAYQISMDYVFQFTDNAKFIQYLMYRSEFEDTTNYFGKSKTAFEAKMTSYFSLGVSYTVDYVNNIASDVRSHTDGVFLAALIADF